MAYNILVVIDESRESLEAVKEAGFMAKWIPAAMIHLLYVFPVFSESLVTENEDFNTLVTIKSEDALKKAKNYLIGHGLNFKEYVTVGNINQEIKIYAQMNRCEMIIVHSKQKDSGRHLYESFIGRYKTLVI